MERDKIYYTLFEQQRDFKEDHAKLVPREITPKISSFLPLKLPIIITGVRRSGKSTLLKILVSELKLKEKSYLYINFNDERFVNFDTEDFQKILDFTIEQNYQDRCMLFIDEIQEVNKWEKWIDRIKEKHQILITGSNSKLLSKEISTILTGRSMSINLQPFSFREFLDAKNIPYKEFKFDVRQHSKIRSAFSEYLSRGGIPKVVTEGDERILSELYENIIYRDIIKRFNYRLEKPIKEISNLLLSSISKELSLRNISEVTGITNLLTTKFIIDTFEKTFLFFFVAKFDYSLRKQIQNPRKVYCIDNGFVTKVGFRFSDDKGRMLENLVFLELRKENKEIYYFSGKNECDFLVKEKTRITQAFQVCYTLNADNREREINGLLEAMEKFSLKKGTIMTFDQEERIKKNGKEIIVIPLWRWLLLVKYN